MKAVKDYHLKVKAPAKINYILEILDKREDGFHNIMTIFQAVSLYDNIYFKDAREIRFTTDAEDLGEPESNLVYKAANLMKKKCSVNRGAEIHLEKNIPVGAGLGGGSSDAAAVIRGLAKLWNLKISDAELHKVALQLGSDVPFFLEGGMAIAKGRGEKISHINRHIRPQIPMIIVYPDFSIPTKWAYETWDELGLKSSGKGIDSFMHAISTRNIRELADSLHNDFEDVVIKKCPKIKEIKDALDAAGSIGSLLSGSGSAVFGLFTGENIAEKALKEVEEKKLGKVYKVRTI
jgi:4-diphosphocytidyl-2-C-methyl-D-erythritol kinase